jgi:hypothetical protein
MQTKTVKNLAFAFAVATGTGLVTLCGAEGMAMAREIMNKSADAFQAAAAIGLGLAGASLFPAIGFGMLWEEKAKADQPAPKVT